MVGIIVYYVSLTVQYYTAQHCTILFLNDV